MVFTFGKAILVRILGPFKIFSPFVQARKERRKMQQQIKGMHFQIVGLKRQLRELETKMVQTPSSSLPPLSSSLPPLSSSSKPSLPPPPPPPLPPKMKPTVITIKKRTISFENGKQSKKDGPSAPVLTQDQVASALKRLRRRETPPRKEKIENTNQEKFSFPRKKIGTSSENKAVHGTPNFAVLALQKRKQLKSSGIVKSPGGTPCRPSQPNGKSSSEFESALRKKFKNTLKSPENQSNTISTPKISPKIVQKNNLKKGSKLFSTPKTTKSPKNSSSLSSPPSPSSSCLFEWECFLIFF